MHFLQVAVAYTQAVHHKSVVNPSELCLCFDCILSGGGGGGGSTESYHKPLVVLLLGCGRKFFSDLGGSTTIPLPNKPCRFTLLLGPESYGIIAHQYTPSQQYIL